VPAGTVTEPTIEEAVNAVSGVVRLPNSTRANSFSPSSVPKDNILAILPVYEVAWDEDIGA
jgi:hypothetical protein